MAISGSGNGPAIPTFRMAKFTRAGLMAGIALMLGSSAVSAQSFLQGKSNGMRHCVQTILGGNPVIETVNVQGHDFNCRPMFQGGNARGNFRQIHLAHAQDGIDDQYTVDFRVDNQNRIIDASMRIRIVKGPSVRTIVTANSYLNSAVAAWAVARKRPMKFKGSSPIGYEQFAEIARAVPATKTPKWETAAFEIAAVAIAEHGGTPARKPSLTFSASHLQK